MNVREYEVKEMKNLLDNMSGMYDLARVVDPIECRVLELCDDGRVILRDSCYSIWNANQKCVNCSSAVACRTGCHQEKAEFFKENIYRIQSNPIKLKLPDGESYDVVLELVSVQKASEDNRIEGINDREQENAGEKSLRHRLLYDSLTGMLKADAFYEKSRELLMNSETDSWKMIIGDIISFRMFRITFGSEKSNEILLKTSEYLKKIAKDKSGICSRLYRDKFAVLIPSENYSEDDFTEVAKTISTAFSTGVYALRIHFGVYDIPDSDIPISVICDRANKAMYSTKGDFGSMVAYFDETLLRKNIAEQKVVSEFEAALEEGQFQMYLQPLIKEDGKPFGAEALARWIRPDGIVVMPSDFIPALENSALIHKLDENIWEQAVRRLSLWKNTEKSDLTISVNMSVRDFYNLDIYRVLTGLMEKYDVECSKLRLELTESTLIENPESIYPMISKLQEAGFLVEIDDFGKGQSSLSLLKDINADILKIDMGFLRETENAKRSQIILKSVITMAKELGMQVITEGVETEQQLKYLSLMGCNNFQGYYFSHPIPVEEFETKYAV